MMSVTLTLTVLILMGVSTVSATRATLAVDWCAQVCYIFPAKPCLII